jgi:membrane protein YqaA with SNARE-associated domain
MGQLTEALLSSSGWAALAVLFMLPALEAPAFLGLVLPGELALLLGGVLASQGRIPLGAALAVGVAGAVAGDSAGYWIGRRWGSRLLASGLGRRVGPARLHKVEALLRGGGWALVVGRGTAGARVVLAAWPACSACATGPSPSGRERPRPSGRQPMSCSATPPVLAGATSTSSPGGSAWRSPWRWWSPWPPPGSSAARPRDTTTSQASPSPQGGAASRPAAGATQPSISSSGSGGEGWPWPATIEGRQELDGVCDRYDLVTRGESRATAS